MTAVSTGRIAVMGLVVALSNVSWGDGPPPVQQEPGSTAARALPATNAPSNDWLKLIGTKDIPVTNVIDAHRGVLVLVHSWDAEGDGELTHRSEVVCDPEELEPILELIRQIATRESSPTDRQPFSCAVHSDGWQCVGTYRESDQGYEVRLLFRRRLDGLFLLDTYIDLDKLNTLEKRRNVRTAGEHFVARRLRQPRDRCEAKGSPASQ